MAEYIIPMVVAFVIAALLGPVVVPFLYKIKAGQSIREIGPAWHQKKSGTPTMGGFIFIIAISIAMILFVRTNEGIVLAISALAFGAIGFIDDYIKVVKKRNLGLTAAQKFLLQLLVSVAVVLFGRGSGMVTDEIIIPFMKNPINLSYFYIPFCVLVMLATVNSVNLTDGLDGLATSVTIIVMLFFAAAALILKENSVAAFAVATVGALIGFFIYNAHPAKVFMGDTGSLYLGGLVATVAILLKLPIFILIVGFVYFAETLSVIIQVTSFKLTGKRVFKMSPLHHHFEMCGLSEVKIVLLFSLVTVVGLLISLLAI